MYAPKILAGHKIPRLSRLTLGPGCRCVPAEKSMGVAHIWCPGTPADSLQEPQAAALARVNHKLLRSVADLAQQDMVRCWMHVKQPDTDSMPRTDAASCLSACMTWRSAGTKGRGQHASHRHCQLPGCMHGMHA